MTSGCRRLPLLAGIGLDRLPGRRPFISAVSRLLESLLREGRSLRLRATHLTAHGAHTHTQTFLIRQYRYG